MTSGERYSAARLASTMVSIWPQRRNIQHYAASFVLRLDGVEREHADLIGAHIVSLAALRFVCSLRVSASI